jgi:hypothetical protein
MAKGWKNQTIIFFAGQTKPWSTRELKGFLRNWSENCKTLEYVRGKRNLFCKTFLRSFLFFLIAKLPNFWAKKGYFQWFFFMNSGKLPNDWLCIWNQPECTVGVSLKKVDIDFILKSGSREVYACMHLHTYVGTRIPTNLDYVPKYLQIFSTVSTSVYIGT